MQWVFGDVSEVDINKIFSKRRSDYVIEEPFGKYIHKTQNAFWG